MLLNRCWDLAVCRRNPRRPKLPWVGVRNEFDQIPLCRIHCPVGYSRTLYGKPGSPLRPAAPADERATEVNRRPALGRTSCRMPKSGSRAGCRVSVCRFPFLLQGAEQIGTAVRSQKLVLLDHGGGTDAQGWQGRFHADHACGEANAHRIREGNVGWKREGNFGL